MKNQIKESLGAGILGLLAIVVATLIITKVRDTVKDSCEAEFVAGYCFAIKDITGDREIIFDKMACSRQCSWVDGDYKCELTNTLKD